MGKMIKIILELELVYPYKLSLNTLIDFCGLWECIVCYGGTNKLKAVISMPAKHFKRIFGHNPREKQYPVPNGMEKFIEKVKVKEIRIKEEK